ncbi:Hypothetical protein, putative [Bodo saltans]|uniref:Uncharacterized protein n=1 Tax=Bodo saltans TaxID=75058 RepID=A0A0S4KGH9_BODSA|nr:Hypothetical protein, putative [Bodo saltans]|eukprot:CUI14804.1 Hypothetical protein, putative [Bodo saltans]
MLILLLSPYKHHRYAQFTLVSVAFLFTLRLSSDLLFLSFIREDSKVPLTHTILLLMLQIPRHQQPQRVHSAAARFRLPDFERSREQLELLQIGIDPQEEKLRQQDQKHQISSTPPSDALAAEPFSSAASPAAMMARRFEEVLANKNVKEVRRVLQERSQQRASTASAVGGATTTSLRIGTRTERHTQDEGNRKRLSTEPSLTHHHLDDDGAPPLTRPVTVGDIQRRRQENWGNSLADRSALNRHGSHQNSSNTMTKKPDNTAVQRHVSSAMNYGGCPMTMISRAAHKLPPRGCTPTAADPLQLLEESIITSTTTAQMLHREDAHDHLPPRPSTSLARLSTHNSHQHREDHNTTDDDDHLVVKRIRRPQSVGGTWDHAMPNNYALSPALAATDDVNVVRRLLQDTRGVACSDITDLADDVFDLHERARTTQQQGEESSSGADSDSDNEHVVREEDDGALQLRRDDDTADPLYTHDDLMRMKLEIQRYELSEELARLVARRVALQQAKEQKVEERLAIRKVAEDNIRSYDENHKLIAGEMDAQWAAYRKKLDDERAAVRLRQLPVVNGVVRKKFLLPKFPSPWALIDVEKIPPPPPSQSPPSNNNNTTTYNVEDNEEYDSLMATAIVSPKTSRPGSSSANRAAGGQQQQQQQDPPQWKREMEVSQQRQGPMRSQSATTIAKRKRAIDRKRLAALPEAQRQEVYAMRVTEFNRHVTRVEPDGRNEVVELEVRERAAMIALLEDGLVEESRQRRTLVGYEQKGWHSIFASAAGELRSLQTREWAPTVFADKKRQEQRAAAEVASPSERQAVLEAANESHRRNIRAVWDKTFELRAQLLTVQRQTLAKKDEIRFARNAAGELSALSKNAAPIPGVSITRTDVAATGATQRLQILELQLDMLEEKQSELRKSIDVLQKTTW